MKLYGEAAKQLDSEKLNITVTVQQNRGDDERHRCMFFLDVQARAPYEQTREKAKDSQQ